MIKVTDKGYWMDGYLRQTLNSIIYNLGNDWDSVIAITGSGLLRVGKSVLAQQCAYYCAYHLKTSFTADNIMFSGDELIKFAHNHPKNTVMVLDESRAELDARRAVQRIGNILRDFFSECGVYNDLIFVVLPDFFELNWGLAIHRTEFLLNVYRKMRTVKAAQFGGELVQKFERGFFECYDRPGKRNLWILGKKHYQDYNAGKNLRTFYGEFKDFWTVNREDYDKKKLAFLKRERENSKAAGGTRPVTWQKQRNLLIQMAVTQFGMKETELAKWLKEKGFPIDQRTISVLSNDPLKVG